MNRSLLATLVTGVLLSTVPVAAPVEATSAIQRCESPDGSLVYTDKSCAAFSAKTVPMSGELLTRIAHEDAREQSIVSSLDGNANGMDANRYPDAAMPLEASADSTIPVSRRGPGSGCARTPTQLAMDVEGSMGLHDVNRLAESWHWVGMTQAQATPVMKRLEQLARAQVHSTRYFDAQMGFGLQLASAGDVVDGRAGILQVSVGGEGGTRSMELNVERYAGCYFVHF
jgi:hypothetical protein